MTEKLYYADSHLFTFSARVLRCEETAGGITAVLDKTAFFPEGGGQAADTGFIGSVRVRDVQEKGGEILHYLESPVPVGELLPCQVDAEQRLRRMQNHSGEHILSGLAHRHFGCENVGFHMAPGCLTIDFDRELSKEQLTFLETEANTVIRANLPVLCTFPTAEELAALTYRSKKELTGEVRIVTIGENAESMALCISYLRVISWFYYLAFIGHSYVGWYRGTGRMNITFWGTTLQIAFRVVGTYLLVHAMGLDAVALSTGLGWVLIVLFHSAVFVLERKGIWPKAATETN